MRTRSTSRHECPTCQKIFEKKAGLVKHMNIHRTGRFPCEIPDCDRKGLNAFKRRDHLRYHLQFKHNVMLERRRHPRPNPSSPAHSEREMSVTSGIDTLEDSMLSLAGQRPQIATTGREKSPDIDRGILDRRAMECEITLLKEKLEASQKQTKEALQMVQVSREFEERLKTAENLATCYEPMACEIRSLKEKLEDAQKQNYQEIQKSRELEVRLEIMENRASQTEAMTCEIRFLKEKLEAAQDESKGLYEQRVIISDNFATHNEALACEIRSLKEKLKDAQEQNDQEIQKSRELEVQLEITENLASQTEAMACEIRSLKEKLEATQKLEERLKIAENLTSQMACEITSMKERLEAAQEQNFQEIQKSRTLEERLASQEQIFQEFCRVRLLATENIASCYEVHERDIKSIREILKATQEHHRGFNQRVQKVREEQLIITEKFASHNEALASEIKMLKARLKAAQEQIGGFEQRLIYAESIAFRSCIRM